jgi:putative nucleotidyltransferase with HDIG domain
MDDQLIADSQDFVEAYYEKHFTSVFTYHNLEHTNSVVAASAKIAAVVGLEDADIKLLHLAALFHDIGYATDAEEHEASSAAIAGDFLQQRGLPQDKISRVQELILSTNRQWKGDDLLSKVLRDADHCHLGAKDYLMFSNRLRIEFNQLYNRNTTPAEWRRINIDYFTSHAYHTEAARELYGKRKRKNLKKIVAIGELSGRTTEDHQTLTQSKSAQTQVKTALRNHIDLSAIADNKASMMVTINAMILTVGLPLLISNLENVPHLFSSTIVVALTSVVSMIFATMATKPIQMDGLTDIALISQRKTNLFFFGNFYKMSFDDYEEGINQVIGDDELLNNSIARDLFFLGKSLGKKYDYLRTCYNVFMIGITLATILGLVFFLFDICPR